MDSNSEETLYKVEHNDPRLTDLSIAVWSDLPTGYVHGRFFSEDNNDFNRLGSLIATNSNLRSIYVSAETILDVDIRVLLAVYTMKY